MSIGKFSHLISAIASHENGSVPVGREAQRDRWLLVAARIRTIWFLAAMIWVVVLVTLLGLVVLLLLSPLMAYARLTGQHLKDPRRKDRFDALCNPN